MSPLVVDPGPWLVGAMVALGRLGGPLAAAAALILAPGLLLGLAVARGRAGDALAAAPGLGLLALALLWWTADLVGLPLGSAVLGGYAALGLAGVAVAFLRGAARATATAGWLSLIWLLTLGTRLAVVGELALPAWVDGVHHTYLTRLLLERGAIPADYGPLLPFGPFAYHFGFHALAASAAALSGALPPDAVLAAGQLLSACAAPAAFLLARLYGASPSGALVAAASAGLVSMMPAYYVSWSRFTELAGLIVAPAWLLLARRAGQGPAWAVLGGLASAAVLFVHPRIVVMMGLLVVVDRLIAPQRWSGRARWLPIAPAVGLAVAAPWLGRLFGELIPRLGLPTEGMATANALDLSALTSYRDPWFYALAAAIAVVGLTAGDLGAWTLAAWLALAFVAANPSLVGLPGSYMLSNGAVVIALWLPAAALIGRGAGALFARLPRPTNPAAATWAARLAPAAFVLVAIALADAPLRALNPGTVLATPRDRAVLANLGATLPADAVVAVNTREWQLRTYMGTDAGYWIGVITPGRAIVPPLLYGLGPPAEARAIGERLARWQGASGDPRALASQMRALGAGWLFLGERGTGIDRSRLGESDGFYLVLADGDARLYRLR